MAQHTHPTVPGLLNGDHRKMLDMLEKIVNIMQIRALGFTSPPEFDKYTDADLATYLARYAVDLAAALS